MIGRRASIKQCRSPAVRICPNLLSMDASMTTTQTDVDHISSRDSSDAILRLRVWGTSRCHALPDASGFELIGSSNECTVQLCDRFVASKHALIKYEHGQWWVTDLGSPHGVRQDGVYRRRFALTPGAQIGIGRVTLIAESARNARMRDFCQRLLGWSDDRLHDVDHALRAIRLAQACRSPLILCGNGDLVPVAHALHRRMRSNDAPFIVCDPRRRNTIATVRSPANLLSATDAYSLAIGGSLCLCYTRLPRDVEELMRQTCQPNADVQLFICMPSRHRSMAMAVAGVLTIEMPPFQVREVELPRIISEYALDAIETLGASQMFFTDRDREWVLMHSSQSLSDVEKATMRVVALRTSENVSQAAARLGMAPISLTRWLARRAPLRGPERARNRMLAFDTKPTARSGVDARRSRSRANAA